MRLTLKIWRQKDAKSPGEIRQYSISDVSPDSSFLEMLDKLNVELAEKGEEPVAFDSDCREGICGTCSLTIQGIPHGPEKATTACQLHMRSFKDGEEIYIEPFRAKAFPVVRDLMTDRSAFDRIIQAGGFCSVNAGGAPDANCLPVPKDAADEAFSAAQCIGCGACVAACKNGAAMLFTSAKVGHLASLPQGQAERSRRVLRMVRTMDEAGFGNCTNYYECEAVCPKEISVKWIRRMNLDYWKAALFYQEEKD